MTDDDKKFVEEMVGMKWSKPSIADCVARLCRIIRELEAEVIQATNQRNKFHDDWYSAAKRADRLQAEIERLKKNG